MGAHDNRLSRRGLLLGSILTGFAGAASAAKAQPANPDVVHPLPAQAPAKEGLAELPGTRLWYVDTGGNGRALLPYIRRPVVD